MRQTALAAALALALAGCAGIPSQTASMQSADAASLAAAETAFAAHSVREDMRAAFLAHFAEDGVFVRNGWTNANAYLAGRPAPPIVLDWRPAYTEVAASGEMGLSTGPWKITSKAKPEAPPAFGQFVSVWKRMPGKPWKVAVDLGISHVEPSLWDAALETAAAPAPGQAAAIGIAAAEERFARDALELGARAAYERHGSQRLRLYRDATPPALGKAAALASGAIGAEKLAWRVEASEVSRAGDFGYARGAYASAAGAAKPLGWFLRVWRLEAGEWRIALDVTNPAPPS